MGSSLLLLVEYLFSLKREYGRLCLNVLFSSIVWTLVSLANHSEGNDTLTLYSSNQRFCVSSVERSLLWFNHPLYTLKVHMDA